jgi:phosphoribosylaminoimidazolecarboxamide formyltransferase / IMP cyclohydrolase
MLKIRRSIISVYDKTGVLEFAKELVNHNVEIISTGGTYKYLKENEIPVTSISDVTGFPEILDGRVKTLHPNIHAGLLAVLENPKHMDEIGKLSIKPIDLICINLYPFEETVKNKNLSQDEIIEQIDIGGPSMLRGASKNYKYTAALSDPKQYAGIIEELKNNDGCLSETTCLNLAKEVFRLTSYYDSLIFNYFDGIKQEPAEEFPEILTLGVRKEINMRYGENPHQQASLYGKFTEIFDHLHGKELSYNNIMDISASVSLMLEFTEPAAVIVKHNNPCGVAIGNDILEAYNKAFLTDTKSAYGGIIALNRPLDMKTAEVINQIFTEVVIATEIPEDVLAFLKKKKDRRILVFKKDKYFEEKFQIKNVIGGYLLQNIDNKKIIEQDLKVVTKRVPTKDEIESLLFGWKVVKHTKSNAIVFSAKDRALGIGAGQMNRVDSAKIAIMKAKEFNMDLKGSVVASDAYFPFADSIEEAVNAGATAIIEPGGSIRDNEVIEAADRNNIAMVFTGIRHFRH